MNIIKKSIKYIGARFYFIILRIKLNIINSGELSRYV